MSRSDPLQLPALFTAPRSTSGATASAVDVQVMGQPGLRRGLREGAPALARARTAYLSTEWSGADDRRPQAGLLVRGGL